MRWGISRSRIKSQESMIEEVLNVWRLNSQCGTQEFLKIGKKCFRRKFEKHSRRMLENGALGSRWSTIAKKKLTKSEEEFLEVE